MKKTALYYSIAWLVSLALFNLITFVVPDKTGGKFGVSFWVGYIFITVAFVGQLVCTVLALTKSELKKIFYNLPLIRISYSCVVMTLIAGGICMAVPFVSYWVAVIVCALVLGFYIIAVLKVSAATAVVADADVHIAVQTAQMRALVDEARGIMLGASDDMLRDEAKKVYEALYYADPTDHADLSELHWQIKGGLRAFATAVKDEDANLVAAEARNLLILVETRNMKLKALK